jgi:hypothetical protein
MRRLSAWLLFLWATVGWIGPCSSQQTSPYGQSIFYGAATDPVARIQQLKEAKEALSENENVLTSEINSISQELAIGGLQTRPYDGRYPEYVKSVFANLRAQIAKFKTIDCAVDQQVREYVSNIRQVNSQILSAVNNTGYLSFDKYNQVTTGAWLMNGTNYSEAQCRSFQAGADGWISDLASIEENVDANVSEQRKQYSDTATKYTELNDLLRKRLKILQDKLASLSPQVQISQNLWIIMAVICVFSLSTIISVKLFDPLLQMEWIASGQVIQFVTVMILLSAIMALGLSGILKENTLGTLLGGVAGYVLAQGIGRAAVREAARANRRGVGPKRNGADSAAGAPGSPRSRPRNSRSSPPRVSRS